MGEAIAIHPYKEFAMMPIVRPAPIPCTDCARMGLPDVMMQFMMFDDIWMNVVVAEPDVTYRKSAANFTQRKKVRTAVWRCPSGHRHQQVPA
jgi:hypothetical protein